MLRTAAHCVHVLTLPIKNFMLVRWRTFIACADNFCVLCMKPALIYFFWNYQLLWRKVCTPAYRWKAYDSRNAMVHTNMSGHYMEMSRLVQKWASMSINEHVCFIMSVNNFLSNWLHARVSWQKMLFPFSHNRVQKWASLFANMQRFQKILNYSKKCKLFHVSLKQ